LLRKTGENAIFAGKKASGMQTLGNHTRFKWFGAVGNYRVKTVPAVQNEKTEHWQGGGHYYVPGRMRLNLLVRTSLSNGSVEHKAERA